MVYLVYKTTNQLDGKFYIGIHKQETLGFDGYLGSGLLLWRAIEKYGESSFVRETLFVCDTLNEARTKERELVTPEFCLREDTYNISVGGTGGFTTARYTKEERKKIAQKTIQTKIEHGTLKYSGENLERAKRRMLACRIQPQNKGRVHTGQPLENMRRASENKTGQYIWITNGNETVLHSVKDELPKDWYRGRGEDCKKFVSHSDESKLKIAEKIKGDVCYNNGTVNLKLKIGDIPPEGFVRGMIQKRKKRKWITNGEVNKQILQSEDLPDGWTDGRTISWSKTHPKKDTIS